MYATWIDTINQMLDLQYYHQHKGHRSHSGSLTEQSHPNITYTLVNSAGQARKTAQRCAARTARVELLDFAPDFFFCWGQFQNFHRVQRF